MINSIAIDDEGHCLETLSILLNSHCPEVQLNAQCHSASEGLKAIAKFKPDLVFLDIEMPVMGGFEMLESLAEISFGILFTTGYDQYAIRAIHHSALDYLLKPIDPGELVAAIQKVQNRKYLPSAEQFEMLMHKIQTKETRFSKIAIPTAEGFELIPADQVISCEADDNYTHFFLKNRTKITACRTLKEVEEILSSFTSFIRVHHSYIVNLNEVTKYVRGEGGYLVMSDLRAINVSRARKDSVLRVLGT